MMHRFLFLVLSLFLSIQAFSQSYSPKWGPVYKKEGGLFASYELIGIEGDYYYMIMRPKKSNTLLKYDMKHKLVSNKQLNLKYNKENILLDKFIQTKNGTFGYLNSYDKKKKQWRIFASSFNDGDFGKVRQVFNHEFKIQMKLFGFGLTTYTNNDNLNNLIVSPDKSHVVYTNILSSVDKNSQEELAVAVFDADMNQVWKKVQKFKYADKEINVKQTIVSNDGVVYVLATVRDKKKKKAKGLPKFDYKAFRITKEGMKEFSIKLGNNVAPVDAALYFPNNDSEFVLAGFYTDAERKSGLKGLFYASGNAETGIKNTKINKFDAAFLEDIARQKNIKKDRGLSMSYNIDNFFEFDDGSIGFIAEQDYVETRTRTDSQGRISYYYIYHTNSIIMPRFSPEGELLNLQKIPKSFASGASALTSYSIAFANDKLYLVFNDFKDKEERTDGSGKKGKRKWRYTDLVVINKSGEIEHNKTLFNSKDIELEFIPSMSDYSDDKLLIGSASAKKYSFGLIDLN